MLRHEGGSGDDDDDDCLFSLACQLIADANTKIYYLVQLQLQVKRENAIHGND